MHEDRNAFQRMWTLFWDTVSRVTGQPVQFKAFSGNGQGLRAVLVDGCKPQVDALGDFLVKHNNSAVSGITESNPEKIVEYVIKLCSVHCDR